MGFLFRPTPAMVRRDEALPGRASSALAAVAPEHLVFGIPVDALPDGSQLAYFALGCFWGEEKMFWGTAGVTNTAVGYQGGFTPNPTYEESCTGRTGHAEAVLVAYDPARITPEELLAAFWENHDPTQRNRQGNDIGTAYRSAVYFTTPEQEAAVEDTRKRFQGELSRKGFGEITTEVAPAERAGPFYYAEDYHQQYLHKNPGGYCNHGPYGCSLPPRD